MSSTFTTGRGHLEKPANGDDVDTWNVPLAANSDVIDACLSTSTNVSLTGGSVALNQAQMQSARLFFSGTAPSNVTVTFLAGISGYYIVSNALTNPAAFTVTLAQSGGVTMPLPTSGSIIISLDGSNVIPADDGGIRQLVSKEFLPPGAIADFAMATAPLGWLVCDGSAISRTTFAPLFANLGTTWGVGNGSTTFNLPNFQGVFRRGWDQGGGIDPARAFASFQGDEFKQHNHGITEPNGGLGHKHTVPVVAAVNQAGGNNSSPLSGAGLSVDTSFSVTGITVNNAGTAAETRPKNYAVLTCIKT